MGWKTIKEHYKIEHIVHVVKGLFCIGSHMVSDLVTLDAKGSLVREAIGSWSDNRFPWISQIKEDSKSGKFKELAEAPDSFGELMDVFTHSERQIIKKQCEKDAYGYPHCCTDGQLMYENTFFKTESAAKKSLTYDCASWLISISEQMGQRIEELEDLNERIGIIFEGLINSGCFGEKIAESLAWRIEQMEMRRENRISRAYKKLFPESKEAAQR